LPFRGFAQKGLFIDVYTAYFFSKKHPGFLGTFEKVAIVISKRLKTPILGQKPLKTPPDPKKA
jgi:hypothetical protein